MSSDLTDGLAYMVECFVAGLLVGIAVGTCIDVIAAYLSIR
jgi:hypothetical protein